MEYNPFLIRKNLLLEEGRLAYVSIEPLALSVIVQSGTDNPLKGVEIPDDAIFVKSKFSKEGDIIFIYAHESFESKPPYEPLTEISNNFSRQLITVIM